VSEDNGNIPNEPTAPGMSLITNESAIYASIVKAGRAVTVDGSHEDMPLVIEFRGKCLYDCDDEHLLHVLIKPESWLTLMEHLADATEEFLE
jgi:hypothetical protein